jgi:group II intron reverse transcriptase/maturase
VRAALDRILRNRGSKTPGVDGLTRDGLKAEWSKQALVDEIVREMRSKSYQPNPIRRVYIPKPSDPSKQRPLGIATLKDRVVQESVRMILEPIYEPRFYPHSYGFRPFRSAHHALARIHYLATAPRKYEWVVEGDIRDCFGSIDHGILLRMMRQAIHDRSLLHVMQAMLKAGVLDGLAHHEPEGGSPQGSVVSPLWANIYLSALDRFVAAKYASQDVKLRLREVAHGRAVPCDIVRYADDCAARTRRAAQTA